MKIYVFSTLSNLLDIYLILSSLLINCFYREENQQSTQNSKASDSIDFAKEAS